jgi:hypothetical protein
LPSEPIAPGLMPPGTSSVAPNGIPTGPAGVLVPGIPNGDVVAIKGVTVCAKVGPQPSQAVAAAIAKKRFIKTSSQLGARRIGPHCSSVFALFASSMKQRIETARRARRRTASGDGPPKEISAGLIWLFDPDCENYRLLAAFIGPANCKLHLSIHGRSAVPCRACLGLPAVCLCLEIR